jgi:hypothetical protein
VIIPLSTKKWDISQIPLSLHDYLLQEDVEVHNHDILASIQIGKNHTNPLTVAKKFATGHTIVGHGMQNLMVKEQPRCSFPYVLWSTGSLTCRKQSDSLNDKLGDFHHVFGAIVVLPDGTSSNVHFCKNGTFTYKGVTYKNDEGGSCPTTIGNIVILGDLHAKSGFTDALHWAIDKLKGVKIDTLVLHDALDMETVNPHSSHSRRFETLTSISEEVNLACKDIKDVITELGAKKVLFTPSNHPDMLSRYFANCTIADLTPCDFSLLKEWDACGRVVEEMIIRRVQRGLPISSSPNCANPIKLALTSTYDDIENGVILSEHGHHGTNGARGTSNGFFTSGIKIIHGHTHTPFRRGGVNCVGTLTNRWQDYMKGGCSSHLQSFVILTNGKSQHLIRFEGE